MDTQFIAVPQRLMPGFERYDGKKKLFTGNSLLVYTAIMQHFPRMFPSIKTICKITGLCRNTVFKHLRILEDNRAIGRFKRHGTSNIYSVNWGILTKKMSIAGQAAYESLKKKWLNRKLVLPKDQPVPRTNPLTRSMDITRCEKLHFLSEFKFEALRIPN